MVCPARPTIDGFKFRRQQPIGPYIADFVCFETKLIIELDGGQHGSEQAMMYDEARTRFLQGEASAFCAFPLSKLLAASILCSAP